MEGNSAQVEKPIDENRGRIFLKIIYFEHLIAYSAMLLLIPTFFGTIMAIFVHGVTVPISVLIMLCITAYGSKPKYYTQLKWMLTVELIAAYAVYLFAISGRG